MTLRGCSTHLNVGIVQSALGIHLDKNEDGIIFNARGYEYNVLKALATALKFNYTLVDRSGQPHGSVNENGTWTGIIGDLITESIDIALATLTVTQERMEVVDFSPPYLEDTISFFVQPQKISDLKGVFYVEPFKPMTWLVVLTSIITYATLLQVLLNRKYNGNGRALMFVLANILHQGYAINSRRNRRSRRSITILVVFWLFTSTIISFYYECSLTASASVSDAFAINTLRQLIPYFERKELEIGVLDGSNYFDFVMTSASTKLNSDLFRSVARVLSEHDDTWIDLLIEGKLAYLVGAKYFMMEMYERNQTHKYHKVKESLCYENLAIAMKKNFSCKNEIGRVINILRETGCLDKWEHDLTYEFFERERQRKQRKIEGYSPINGEHLENAFFLCFGGLLISFLVYNVERAIAINRNKQEVKTMATTDGKTLRFSRDKPRDK